MLFREMRFSKKNEGNEGSSQGKIILSLYYTLPQFYIIHLRRKEKKNLGRIIFGNPSSLAKIKSRRANASLIQFQYIWFPHIQSLGSTAPPPPPTHTLEYKTQTFPLPLPSLNLQHHHKPLHISLMYEFTIYLLPQEYKVYES